MCTLLQYFCDCELRHRVEAIIAFSDQFVSQIQSNQRQRYNELMLAFTMTAAETARKTREFRSPPQEQVHADKCREQRTIYHCVKNTQKHLTDLHFFHMYILCSLISFILYWYKTMLNCSWNKIKIPQFLVQLDSDVQYSLESVSNKSSSYLLYPAPLTFDFLLLCRSTC